MTFANVCVDRTQLMLLSQLLLTAFPGCVIHQNCDPVRTFRNLSTEAVDAVFVDADTRSEVLQLLNSRNAKPSVYLLCQHDTLSPEETGGIHRVITYPITKQKIQGALQTVPPMSMEAI